jgi:hypothetical protein
MFAGCASKDEQDEIIPEEILTKSDAADALHTPEAFLFLDYAAQNESQIELNLLAACINGSFAADINTDALVFSGDLANAQDVQIVSVNDDHNQMQISLLLDGANLDAENLELSTSLTFQEGAILDTDGNALEDYVIEKELSNHEEERNLAQTTRYEYEDTKTLVYQIDGELGFLDELYGTYFENSSSSNYPVLILDFTNCTGAEFNSTEAIYYLMYFMDSPYTVVVNADQNAGYYSSLQSDVLSLSGYYAFVSGDDSLIDYTKSSVFEDILKLIRNKKFTVIG